MLSDVALGLSFLLGVVLLVTVIGYFVVSKDKKKEIVRFKVDRMYYDVSVPQYINIPRNRVNVCDTQIEDDEPFVDPYGYLWLTVDGRNVIRDCKEVKDA